MVLTALITNFLCNNSSSQGILPKGTLLQKSLSSFQQLLNSILRQCFLSSTLHNVSLNASPRISSYFGRPPLSLCCMCDHLTLSLFAPSLWNVTMLVSMSILYAHNYHQITVMHKTVMHLKLSCTSNTHALLHHLCLLSIQAPVTFSVVYITACAFRTTQVFTLKTCHCKKKSPFFPAPFTLNFKGGVLTAPGHAYTCGQVLGC